MAKARQPQSDPARLDLQAVLATDAGRRFVWRLVMDCGVFDPMPTINGQQQWHEGKRDVGLALMQHVKSINPNLIPLMMQDHLNEELHDEQRNRGR